MQIVLPTSGWLVGFRGRKRFFFDLMCFSRPVPFCAAIAPSLGLCSCFGSGEGAVGGGLQPMARTILGHSFPPAKRRVGLFALYGITAICAPAIGHDGRGSPIATLGAGSSTSTFSCAVALVLVYRDRRDPPYLAARREKRLRFDYIGFSLLTVGVGACSSHWTKGQEKDDWFGSHFITT